MKLKGKDKSLDIQVNILEKIIMESEVLNKILKVLDENFGYDYYVTAGSINQTIFNYYHGYPLDNGIDDIDIVYFDKDTSYEIEDKIIKEVSELLKDINIRLDIKNQARVHLWYGKKFGHEIDANKSVEEAISKWGTTVTCIGVRISNGKFKVYAPYGLNDLFKMTIRPVKDNFIKEDYDKKCAKWKEKWKLLTIIPWDNN